MLTIRNGRVAGVRFVAANSSGGEIRPSLIVLHDTAGHTRPGSSVDWFRSRECKTSAHFVVELDGTITQMVATNRKAFHAGQSTWGGRTFCNSFSVGIEIVNPGLLRRRGDVCELVYDDKVVQHFAASACQHRKTAEHGDGWWLPYTPAQIEAVKHLCRAIVAEYPDCNEIVTHWMIAPRRKIDTGPLLPLEDIRDYALGQHAAPAGEPEADVPEWTATASDTPSSMATSTTGNTAVAVGTGSGVPQIGMASSQALSQSSTPKEFVVALLANPLFWTGLLTICGVTYIWLERQRKLITYGI